MGTGRGMEVNNNWFWVGKYISDYLITVTTIKCTIIIIIIKSFVQSLHRLKIFNSSSNNSDY